MKTIESVDIAGKRILIRVDFNVPLDDHQHITDDTRLRGVLPTLRYALAQQSKLILASHLGRPKGKPVAAFSLSPVALRLQELLQRNVKMAPDCVGQQVSAIVDAMNPGDVVLLENLRYHPGEQANDERFAQSLAALCDVYINDAFAVSHRVNASVEAITRYAPECAAGLLVKKELDTINKSVADPQRPLVAIIGGAKVSTKLGALNNMMHHVDKIIIGGAMANTFLKSMGYRVGASRIEEDLVESAGAVMQTARDRGLQFLIPIDVVVATAIDPAAVTKVVPVQDIPSDWMALDIGPSTIDLFGVALVDAKTIVWNGPMGVFEIAPFSHGTMAMVDHVAAADAVSIVGGGDTDVAIHKAGKADQISYISTGGGAFLAMLEGKTLPAIAALEKSNV